MSDRLPGVVAQIVGHATQWQDRMAVTDDRRRLTYAQLLASSRQCAARLSAAGVGLGDRVALISENSADYLVATLGVWIAGAVLAPVHPAFGPSEVEYVMGNCEPVMLLTESGDPPSFLERPPATSRLSEITRFQPGDREAELAETELESPAIIYYTSGSTGRPKPVAHSHRGVASGCRTYAQVWHLSAQDVTLVCLPMSWAFGLTTGSIVTLISGGGVVVLPKYNPVRFVAAFDEHPITIFHGVTTMFVKLLDYLADARRDLRADHLRLCISGGEPRNEPAFERWRQLTGTSVLDTYCASECWPVVTYDPWLDPQPHSGAAGRIVPGAELRVVDSAGVDVAPGEIGEGLWRAPGQMIGYWNEPELTAAAVTDDGWFRSRDLARVDAAGYVYVAGRVADTIIRGGSNVSPAEVEAVLSRHPTVRDVVVVGLPDPVYGEEVVAVVVLTADAPLDPEALAALARTELAEFKVPTRYQRVDELPSNANGKRSRRDIASVIRGDALSVG